jgi:hypothetical protein
MRKTIVAAVSIAALLFTSSGASAQVCILGIFVAAAQANSHDNRELTSKEAWSCGLSYWFEAPKPTPKKVDRRTKHHKKAAAAS